MKMSEDGFNYWLAGLIEGDGTLGISGKYSYFELTLDTKDRHTLILIQRRLGYGSVSPRSGVNGVRFRTAQKSHVFDILQRVNGKLLTTSKQAQLVKLCALFGINAIIPTQNQSINIIQTTAWLSGFFDAEGHFNIMNKTTLAFHVGQKDQTILDLIKISLGIGHIRFDKCDSSWKYSITDKEGIRIVLTKFKKHPLLTLKDIDVVSLVRLLHYIDNKHHLKSSPSYTKGMHLINAFKTRLSKYKHNKL